MENPEKSRGSYRDWQDKNEPQSNRDKLAVLIDDNLRAGMLFEQFIAAMAAAGCQVKRGKYLSFKIPGTERFIRVKSLGDDYTEDALRERCVGKRTITPKQFVPFVITTQTKFGLLIDIQQKIQEGKGEAYENWAAVYNLKQMAKTLIYLQANDIDSYDDLVKKSSAANVAFLKRLDEIKAVEERMKQISKLQKEIGTYGKTRETYAAYRNLKKTKQPFLSKLKNELTPAEKFYNENSDKIILHEAAKKYFDSLGIKKLPSINALKQEWATLNAEKNKLYSDYNKLKSQYKNLTTAKDNCERILGINQTAPTHTAERKRTSHDYGAR